MSELTLGGRAARFKAIDGLAHIEALTARDEVYARLAREYPGWAEATEGQPAGGSYFRANAEYVLLGIHVPLLLAAWDGEGELTADQVSRSSIPDRLACCREVRRLNDWLTELPAPAPAPAETEGADPNA